MDDQIGADGEHRRLQHHAQDLGDRAEAARDVAHALLPIQIGMVRVLPALGDPAQHAHGDQRLGVAPAGFGKTVARDRETGRLFRRLAGQILGEHRQRDQDDRADQRGDADQRMKGKADDEVERHPGQIEQRDRAETGQERAYAVEIAQRLQAVVALSHLQRQPHDRIVDPAAERLIEAGADPNQDASADQVENGLARYKGQPPGRRARPASARCGSAARGRRPPA